MEWDSPHIHSVKDRDWFASLIIITGALVFVISLSHDWILAVLVVSIAFAIISVHAREHGAMVHTQIRTGGILWGDTLYSWKHLDSFSIQEYHGVPRLLALPKKQLATMIMIPISPDVDLAELHHIVEGFIPFREDLHLSLPQILLEKLGI